MMVSRVLSTYDDAQRTVDFRSDSRSAAWHHLHRNCHGHADGVGPMAAPHEWSFTTAQNDAVPGICPCSLFNDDDAPVVASANDPGNVELGVSFSADTDGQITGVKFYKGPGNTGAHTVSLWNAAGTQLATAQVTNESTTGWQNGELRCAGPGDRGSDLYRVVSCAGRSLLLHRRRICGTLSTSPRCIRSNNASRYTLRVGRPDQRFDSKLLRRSGVHCRRRFRASSDLSQPFGSVDIGTRHDVGRCHLRPDRFSRVRLRLSLTDSCGNPIAGTMASFRWDQRPASRRAPALLKARPTR